MEELKKSRKSFKHDGRLIYEWEQNMNEVLMFVKPPPGLNAQQINCKITPKRLTLGIKGNPPFINEEFFDTVVDEESMWTLVDGEIEITLQKMKKASTWDSCLKGQGELDPFSKEEIRKKMTLERFQEEHAGFDFSGAEFNGSAPDPRTFLGGVPYK